MERPAMSEQNPLEKLASTELDLLPQKWQDPQRQEIARQARELDGQSTMPTGSGPLNNFAG